PRRHARAQRPVCGRRTVARCLTRGAAGDRPVPQHLPGDLQRPAAGRPRPPTRPPAARAGGPGRVDPRHPAAATGAPPGHGSGGRRSGGTGQGAPAARVRALPGTGGDRRRHRVRRTGPTWARDPARRDLTRVRWASGAAHLGRGVPAGAAPRPVAVHRRRDPLRTFQLKVGRIPTLWSVAGSPEAARTTVAAARVRAAGGAVPARDAGPRRCYFTAPAVTPRTSHLRATTVNNATGTRIMTAMTPSCPNWTPSSVRTDEASTGKVAAWDLVNGNASTRSLHARMNENTLTAARPGPASGRITRRNAPRWPQPSTSAASSSSLGRSMKKPCSIQVANGMLSAMYGRISASRVSSKPNRDA